MFRFAVLLPCAAALAVGAAGCGGDPVTASVAAARTPTAAAPTSAAGHGTAGWSAPSTLPGTRVRALSEEFASAGALRDWGYFEGDFGGNTLRVRDGKLDVEVPRSAWVNGHRAFYVYRSVRGDFDVRARVRVTGRAGGVPAADWSLSGLLVRAAPRSDGDPENWVSLRKGRVGGRWVLERKTTQSSRSRVALVDDRAGWTELRIVRCGPRFALFARSGGDDRWRARGTVVRGDLPEALEVGIDALSGQRSPRADLRSRVDWVRFARSR